MPAIEVFVCARPVALLDGTAAVDEQGTGVDPAVRRWGDDPAAAFALEAALRLRETGQVESVVCVSVGPVEYDGWLARGLATGADRALRVDLPGQGGLDARATGALLGAALGRLGARLVLTAQRSSDEQNGLLAAALAADLDAAYLANVVELRLQGDGLAVERRLERGHRQMWAADLPAVVAFEAGANRPRYVPVAALAMARHREIELLAVDELGVKPESLPRFTERVGLARGRVRVRKSAVPGAGGSAAQRLQAVMGGGDTGAGGKLLSGSTDELADRALDFLEERGLLRGRSTR